MTLSALLLLAFLAVPTASADVGSADCLGAAGVCVQEGPPGCHDFCGFICVDRLCAVCVGDPSSVGSDIRCVTGSVS